jgi:hypothetical protein
MHIQEAYIKNIILSKIVLINNCEAFMPRYDMKKQIFFLLLFFLLPDKVGFFAQNNNGQISVERRELIRKVNRAELMKADVNNYLDKKFFDYYDSIETKYWKNYYWFVFQSSEKTKERHYYLFALDNSKTKLAKVSDFDMYWSDFSSFWDDINFFKNKMYLFHYFYSEATKKHIPGIMVIDEVNLKVQTIIKLREGTWLEDEYVQGDKLFMVVQPKKRRLNLWHYFDFWFPRGRSSKWEYVDDGNKWQYIYDENFNLISKEEIKK